MSNLPAKQKKGVVKKKPVDIPYDHEEEGGFYVTSGKKAPKSTQVQMWANERNISLETLEMDKDNIKAWAKVRATNVKTGQVVEAKVILVYKQIQDKMMIDLAEDPTKAGSDGRSKAWMFKDVKQPLLINEDGEIVANLNTKGMLHVKKQLVNYIYTAERKAETFAATRAFKKILNKDWSKEAEDDQEPITETEKMPEPPKQIKSQAPEPEPEPERKIAKTFKPKTPDEPEPEPEEPEPEEPEDEEREEERKTEEKTQSIKQEEKKTDVQERIKQPNKQIKRVTRKKQETVDTELFPPTRAKEEYRQVPGKQVVGMIREDLEKAEIIPDMKNIAVMLKTLKNEKKISPHQFRVANEYNLDMAF